MDWISHFGRRFWQAYQEGLVMPCPIHRAAADRSAEDTPCDIGLRQYDVAEALARQQAVRH